jgi:gas vesicle protein
MSSGKVVLALLAGVAAGAVLGILFAPEKGSETRKKLSGQGEDLKESMKEQFNQFLDDISEKYENVKEEDADLSDNGKAVKDEADKKAKTAPG